MSKNIADQTLIEHQTLKHVLEALGIVLNWSPPQAGMPRKLETLRFITGALQRHLEHMLALEEQDGYMPQVLESSPHLANQVEALRKEHDEFRETLRQIVTELEQVSAEDPRQVSILCEQLTALVAKLNEHSRKEIDLVQEAFLQEEGGEG